jgi:hypothetical protein
MIRTCLYADCRSEQSFKSKFLHQNADPKWEAFCIETEETVRGFPDVLVVSKEDSTCFLLEFKFTKTGKIKFQPTQPSFYRSHKYMDIMVVAYNAKTRVLHQFGCCADCLLRRSKHCELLPELHDLHRVVHFIRYSYGADMRVKPDSHIHVIRRPLPDSLYKGRSHADHITIRIFNYEIYDAGTLEIHLHVRIADAEHVIQPADLLDDLTYIGIVSVHAQIRAHLVCTGQADHGDLYSVP